MERKFFFSLFAAFVVDFFVTCDWWYECNNMKYIECPSNVLWIQLLSVGEIQTLRYFQRILKSTWFRHHFGEIESEQTEFFTYRNVFRNLVAESFYFLHEHFICLVSRLSFQSHEESFQNNHLKLIGPRNGEKACSKFNWTFSCAVCFDSNETKAWSQQLLWVSAHWFDSDYWIICYESSSEIQEKSTK